MVGTRESLSAIIEKIVGSNRNYRRILLEIFVLFLGIPRRINFKQMGKWSSYNEGTFHNWFAKDLDLASFNRQLIDEYGSGDHFVIFDPSFVSKSGKKTPDIGRYWSGCAGTVKKGLELGAFAVGDLEYHTAFHLEATYTPGQEKLKKKGRNLMEHYIDLVRKQLPAIQHFGNCLCADGYFGSYTFVKPVTQMGISLVSCLKSNVALFYLPQKEGKKRGRPRLKGDRIDWNHIKDDQLPVMEHNGERIIRSGQVYVKCLKMVVLLVMVDYLKKDGTRQARKLYFCTDTSKSYEWVLQRYTGRFQIEFTFRDAKQFTGLTHCQSKDERKLANHANIALTTVSLAKVAHWLSIPKEQRPPFSLSEIKAHYHNLMLLERFSKALDLNLNEIKTNPKIQHILFSASYDALAA